MKEFNFIVQITNFKYISRNVTRRLSNRLFRNNNKRAMKTTCQLLWGMAACLDAAPPTGRCTVSAPPQQQMHSPFALVLGAILLIPERSSFRRSRPDPLPGSPQFQGSVLYFHNLGQLLGRESSSTGLRTVEHTTQRPLIPLEGKGMHTRGR